MLLSFQRYSTSCLTAHFFSSTCVITLSLITFNSCYGISIKKRKVTNNWFLTEGRDMYFLENFLTDIFNCHWLVYKYRTPRKESIESLRRNVKIFHYLCRASSELNDVFSLPAFFILTTKLLFVITVSYVFIYNFFHPNYFLEDYSMAFPYMFVMDSVRIFVLLASADMPVNQVILRTQLIPPVYNLNSSFSIFYWSGSSSPRTSYRNIVYWIIPNVSRKHCGSFLW